MLPLKAPLWQQSSMITAMRAAELSSISLTSPALTAVERNRSTRELAAARYRRFRSSSSPWPL